VLFIDIPQIEYDMDFLSYLLPGGRHVFFL